jgi:excisionase family DNA binding protein
MKATTEKVEPILLKPKRIAALLDTCLSNVYKMIGTGELESVRIGRSVRVPRGAVERLAEKGLAR